MNAFWVISICFGLVTLWVWMYEPKMMIEHEDGRVTFEKIPREKANDLARLNMVFLLVSMWAVALVIVYHHIVWVFLQEFLQFKM